MTLDPADSNLSASFRDLLGYLNFSDGTPSTAFQAAFNDVFLQDCGPADPAELKALLQAELRALHASGQSAFRETVQAEFVIAAALDDVLAAYREHHSDLLFHVPADVFFQPFFLVRVFEAALKGGSRHGWSDRPQLVGAALEDLNQFVGYRPVAVLENELRAEVYGHERLCAVPLFLCDVGVAAGPHRVLLESTLEFLRVLPEDMTAPAHFSVERLDELSLDLRAHDHLHPVNKRTNYMFGEWDPEHIDTGGYYRRFVIRRIILDLLQAWLTDGDDSSYQERLYDASAVLAGTILMASSISGSGPQTYDSDVSLTSLLPVVARQRDTFYQRLLETATGDRRERLERQKQESRQPFGHVRHRLNMNLAHYGASQVQHRHLSWLFASMGFEAASREEAMVIPCTSARFESEIYSCLMLVRREVRSGQLPSAIRQLTTCVDLLHRGIHCGGLVDPWNILGFQGMFPLFAAREDSIPDNRVEILLDLVEQFFDACALVMAEAAATGHPEFHDVVRKQFTDLATQWDTYATTTVADLPEVRGMESVKAAEHVATALAEWRTAGESATGISFWRSHVARFESARSYSQVVTVLLDRDDPVAATGLLIQWLSEAESFGLESGRHSIHSQFQRLLNLITRESDFAVQWQQLRRLFAFLESNAGVFWHVPSLREFEDRQHRSDAASAEELPDLEHLFDDETAEDENLFEAAWENVVFRDSADDGGHSDTIDDGALPGTSEFEILYRQIEPRLKFLHTLGSLWSNAAIVLARQSADVMAAHDVRMHVEEWESAIRRFLSGLAGLLKEISDFEIETWSADLEANIEFDVQMQSRFLLMQNAISTTGEFLMADQLLAALRPAAREQEAEEAQFSRKLVGLLRSVLSDDVESVRQVFPDFVRRLRRRPLLYVPFENGGNPTDILKARTLQAVIRLLLSQLPRLGLLTEAFRLLQTAFQMERNSRPLGQAVTEFDRLFRIGLASSVEAVLHATRRWKMETAAQRRNAFRRIQRLMNAYRTLWATHSSSMRLSIVEELHDEDRRREVREFIERYGDDLFHTRMLTLGNARAIVLHGADALLDELEKNVSRFQSIRLVDDIDAGVINRDEAVELMEFVYESVVDNFDVFLEYNTTTTQSDYGNRLYCLLDFLRLKSLYDRFEWIHLPFRFVHETMTLCGSTELAAVVAGELADETRERADALVDELDVLESDYGVRLPTLHDHICDRIAGALHVNQMAARVARCCPELSNISTESAAEQFQFLRDEIADYMEGRLGSGIDTPEWMTTLGNEQSHVQDQLAGIEATVLDSAEFQRVTQRELDRQLSHLLDEEDLQPSV